MTEPLAFTINIDGAARGNPGPAAFAYVISAAGQSLAAEGRCLGTATNNQAEYTALVRALQRAAELGGRRLTIHSDSELLVKQMNGEYRVKNEDLRQLYDEANALRRQFDAVTIRHVRRADNAHADRLCNEALDGEGDKSRPRSTPAPAIAAVDVVQPAAVREEALACLQAAANAWAQGQTKDLAVEAVWDQLWSILEEAGVVR
ncbi:MAG TPA: ribonuclease HI family protein [Gemmataceae bacterium]|nr:ribonuclease HI family protein [Gemmataceae bacterium]